MFSDSAFAPRPTSESRPFWEGLAAGNLLLPRCASGHSFFPPMPGCPECGADWSPDGGYRPSPGTGSLMSWVVAHYAFDPEFAEDVPYAIVTVVLDEGPRVYGRWLDPVDVLEADVAVRAEIFDRNGQALLGFRRDGASQ